MTYLYRYGSTITASEEVEMDIDIDDVLAELEDDEVAELYNKRFKGGALNERTIWGRLYEKRVHMSNHEFLTFLDTLIQDKTGRIIL